MVKTLYGSNANLCMSDFGAMHNKGEHIVRAGKMPFSEEVPCPLIIIITIIIGTNQLKKRPSVAVVIIHSGVVLVNSSLTLTTCLLIPVLNRK